MGKKLIIKPCFSNGNVGDTALIKTIINLFKSDEIYIPKSKKDLHNTNTIEFDSLIYFGNDCVPYYQDAIPIKKIKDFLVKNKKVHIINTSWGKNLRGINIIKSVANDPNLYIYMRDKFSYDLIQKDINFYNTPILTADLAFLCQKNNNNPVENLEHWISNNDKPVIGINIHNDFKEYNIKVRTELKKFLVNNKDRYRYLFIPHDSRKNEYEYLKQLHKSCDSIDGFTTNYLDPEYEKYITSKLYLVITGRMHLSILTIPNLVPSIAISYNGIKAKGTFQHFNLDNLVLEPENISQLSNNLDFIENNYEKIKKDIEDNLENVFNLVSNTLTLIK